jgi:chemotaxis protein CheC
VLIVNVTKEQKDAITEIVNVGVGKGAEVLNTMLDSHISLQVPSLKILSSDELKKDTDGSPNEQLGSVNMSFKGNFSGLTKLVFSPENASKLIKVLTKEEMIIEDIDSMHAGPILEIGNIVLNSVIGSISNVLELNLTYSVPIYMETSTDEMMLAKQISADTDAVIILAQTEFQAETLDIKGYIVMMLEVGSFNKLIEAIEALMLT